MSLKSENENPLGEAARGVGKFFADELPKMVRKTTIGAGIAASVLTPLANADAQEPNTSQPPPEDVSMVVSTDRQTNLNHEMNTQDRSGAQYLKNYNKISVNAQKSQETILAYIMPEVDRELIKRFAQAETKKDQALAWKEMDDDHKNLILLQNITNEMQKKHGIAMETMPLEVGDYTGNDNGVHAPGTIQIFAYVEGGVFHSAASAPLGDDPGGHPIDSWQDLSDNIQGYFNKNDTTDGQVPDIMNLKSFGLANRFSSIPLQADNFTPYEKGEVGVVSGLPKGEKIADSLDL